MLITERLCRGGWEFHQDIVWNKVTGGVKRAGVFIQYRKPGYYYPNIMTEYVLLFRKPGALRRGRTKALDIDELFTRDIANNVWHIAPVPPNAIDHPCPFPEELARRLVVLYSDEGDEVLDPFLGSGQTALAALTHGRRCVGYDIEESYLRLAEARIGAPRPPPRVQPCPALRAPRGAVTTGQWPSCLPVSAFAASHPDSLLCEGCRRTLTENRRMAGVFRRPAAALSWPPSPAETPFGTRERGGGARQA